jgi:acetylornithine aminotransferase
MAKGMGNGFPVAGVLISPQFKPRHSMLGTTFGGNYLACVAAISVLEVMEQEKLMENAENMGNFLLSELKNMPHIKELRGQGLMIGIELEMPCAPMRQRLLAEHHIFTGSSSQKHTLRILPALNMGKTEAETFLDALEKTLKS